MSPRDRMILPLTVAITVMWLAAGFVALVAGHAEVFVLVNIPFGLVCGFVYREYRRNGNGH